MSIQYRCSNCDGLLCETSICPVCGKRTELISTSVFYCNHCNAPSFEETCPVCHNHCEKIGADIRPVFSEERLLIEILLGKPMEFAGKAVWSTQSGVYFVDGKKIKISLMDARKKDPQLIIDELSKYKIENEPFVAQDMSNIHIQHFVEANRFRLNRITEEAFSYINNISRDFDKKSIFVSFSGGKDSTVTSDLVMRSLQDERIVHIYGDTTLEYPESAKYIAVFRKKHPNTPVLVAKNYEQDFNDLCEVVGPPSRVMRWCCTVFKTGAIAKKIEQTFKGQNRLLSFQGIRRSESLSRSKYDRDSNESKISKQVASSPIIDWLEFDIWLYLLANDVPFNNAYRQGFTRVGCWCCPNNSNWSEFLSSIYMPEQYKKFHGLLYEFAKKVGKEDWKEYIDTGKWKARQGGNGLEYSKNTVVEFKPCVLEENAFNFELNRPIDDRLYTLFKPFGALNFELGNKRLNEVYVISKKSNSPLLKLTGRKGSTTLRVTVLKKEYPFVNLKTSEELIRDQITKFQICIGCTYCQSVCRFNALKVSNTKPGHVSTESISYTIDSTKCMNCLECVRHFDGGCYMKKVLRIKKEN